MHTTVSFSVKNEYGETIHDIQIIADDTDELFLTLAKIVDWMESRALHLEHISIEMQTSFRKIGGNEEHFHVILARENQAPFRHLVFNHSTFLDTAEISTTIDSTLTGWSSELEQQGFHVVRRRTCFYATRRKEDGEIERVIGTAILCPNHQECYSQMNVSDIMRKSQYS